MRLINARRVKKKSEREREGKRTMVVMTVVITWNDDAGDTW